METSSNTFKIQDFKSAVLVNSTIFKLVETIEKKIKSGQVDKDLKEFRQLREQCGSEDPLVSVTACHGLVSLVKAQLCPLPNTISALVASLFSVKSVSGAVSALGELLVLELKCDLSTDSDTGYTCPYNCHSPQHPLVSVLKRRPLAWPQVLNQISSISSHPDKQVQRYSFELVRPVLDYVLRESNDLPESCRLQAFRIITTYYSEKDYLVEALACCLCWESSRVLEAVQMVSLAAQSAVVNKHGLQVSLCCLTLGALVPRLLQIASSPQPVLQLLSQLTASSATTNTHSTLLALLADSIPACPAVYLDDLLTFVVELLGRGQCSQDCVWMCVSALLPWLACSPNHLHPALHTASTIVTHASAITANPSTTASLIDNPAVNTVVSACPRLTHALHIARLSEVLRGDVKATLLWLERNKAIQNDLLHLYMSALLISRPEAEVRLAALQSVVSSIAPIATSHNLTLLLYQLAKEKQPDNQLALLRALPSTAVDKNNVLGVVSTLEALRRSGHLNLSLLAVDLYCQLWMCQERCFPQLMDVLQLDCARCNELWLAFTLQATICKTICTAKPELHGKELVAKVSEILNKCGGGKEAPASALALEALVPLCQQDVIDVFTIWRSLAPRFARDKRPLVLKSLCELVSMGSKQKCSSPEAEHSVTQMLSWLWTLVGTNKNTTVVDQALTALSEFPIDKMTLKMLPECFRRDLKLPAEMVKTPADAARKPEDVLDYIPGECWAQVVCHVRSVSACLAVASWMRMEVASYRNASLYQVDRQEPTTYGHLPQSSVVRGVTSALRDACKTDADLDLSTVNLYLVTLHQPTPKPLPSFSWTFLASLASKEEEKELTHNVVRLCAKQSQISPSARNIMQAYIASSAQDKNKIEFLYSVLTDLCRGIPPTVLRPLMERTLQSAVKESDSEYFSTLLRHLKTTLKEEKIHEANRTMLQQQIKILWDIFEPQHQMLQEYFSCACELPVSLIESMTSTSTMWEVTSVQLQKAFKFRTFMALLPNAAQPLNWLNEIIDVASANISEQSLALLLVSEVMQRLGKDSSAWPWLQELMGQTHLTSTSNKEGVEFLVSVFVLCVDVMSGYSSLSYDDSSRLMRLPQAVFSLVTQHGDTKSMLEWLNHMRSLDSFPSQFAPHFQLAARNISLLIGS